MNVWGFVLIRVIIRRFFGQVPNLSGVFVASGLGSSGLTTGPIIGYHLAQMLQGESGVLDPADYPTERYIKEK